MLKSCIVAFASFALLSRATASGVLSTNGFINCNNGSSTINVNHVDISFDKSTNQVTFDVSGSSSISQEVIATLLVSAYGVQVYSDTFDPCDPSTKVDQLCPVPAGQFGAQGTQTVPSSYADQIPSIAYTVPDLDGNAQMILKAKNGNQTLACFQSSVSNGKSVDVPAVSYVAAAIAVAALALSLISAAAAGGHPGTSSSSPGFMEVMFWFQGMAYNGMHSVPYPTVYRSFTKNFAFSTGIIPWGSMQTAIDNFRQSTGGNLTDSSYQYLKNATLVFPGGSTSSTTTSIAKRAILLSREVATSVNASSSAVTKSTAGGAQQSQFVQGISAYVEQLSVPQANTFMTVLLIFAIIVAAIVVGILLFKVILEAWALFVSFPISLTTFRKEYWRVTAQTVISLILLLYGTWTLYCIFELTHGDSWAAKVLAGVTFGIFTALLGYYSFRIWYVAQKMKKLEGDAGALYENKETWKKYKLFYAEYKRGYWWLFMPTLVYAFAKGCVLASAEGHGLVQTAGQLIIESLMLALLLVLRPFTRKSGNWINIIIQIVRVVSVVCILLFVEELGIAQTTKTITGIVLIAVQAGLTGVLAILLAVNAMITCCRENPHRKRRKAVEKRNREMNDAFLMTPQSYKPVPLHSAENSMDMNNPTYPNYGPVKPTGLRQEDSQEIGLVGGAAEMGKNGYTRVDRSVSPPDLERRQPTLPNLGYGGYRRVN